MSNSYQLVVFDWEGTIADTLGFMLQRVAFEAQKLGFGDIDLYQARKYVGLGLVQALRKLFPDLSTAQLEQLLQAVQQSMILKPAEISLIPGVREFIEQLYEAKIDIAIATNKGHQSLLRALHTTGLDKLFKVTRSAGQVPEKPCPQMLEEIIDEFGGYPETTLMIGDSPIDMEMAKNINVTGVGVDFYQQNETVLRSAGASVVFDNYQSLAHFLTLS